MKTEDINLATFKTTAYVATKIAKREKNYPKCYSLTAHVPQIYMLGSKVQYDAF